MSAIVPAMRTEPFLRGASSYRSMISTVILVRRARSWIAVGDLCSLGMSPGQWSGEADAATRDLRASCVTTSEGCDDCDGGGATGSN